MTSRAPITVGWRPSGSLPLSPTALPFFAAGRDIRGGQTILIRIPQAVRGTGRIRLSQPPGKVEEALAVDESHVVGDLLDTGDLEALAHLDRAYEFGRFEQGFMSPGV